MTKGDSVDKSLLRVFEHTQLSICLFPILREFKMFEEYLDVLIKSENNNQEIQLLSL
jgi:hypothetical protein